jgi:transposase-like protein
MTMNDQTNKPAIPRPSREQIEQALAGVKSADEVVAALKGLVGETLSAMLEAELTAHLGYEKHEASGRNSGNSRNGKRSKKMRSSTGETEIQVPRDRNGTFEPQIVHRYATSTSELEDKIIALYARGMTTRDITAALHEMYGMTVSAETISKVTDKVLPLVEAWQNRPLQAFYPIVWLDAIHIRVRQDGRVTLCPVYIVMGLDLEGKKDVLGHWLGRGGEGSSHWLGVLTELKNRGVEDIAIACVDGLNGFADAIHAVFPLTEVQSCIVHQVRQSIKYVAQKDHKVFIADLKAIYQAPTLEAAETALLALGERWGDKYAVAVRSWENRWDVLTPMFDYTPEIRRLIYTTNPIEAYNRGLRKATKTRAAFPTELSVRKLLWLAHDAIAAKWSKPLPNWPLILNQLAIRFGDRIPL